jgi:hypothetical protein
MARLVGLLLALLVVPILASPQPREWGCMIDGNYSFSNVVGKPSELFPRYTGIVKIRGHDYIDKIFKTHKPTHLSS